LAELGDLGFVTVIPDTENFVRIEEVCPHFEEVNVGGVGQPPDARTILAERVGPPLGVVGNSHRDREWLNRTGMDESVHQDVRTLGLAPHRGHNLSSVYLAKYYFPALCLSNRIGPFQGRGMVNWKALASQINKQTLGPDLEYIRRLMDEFTHHPDWCRTGQPAWIVFIRRKNELAKLMADRDRRNVGSQSAHNPTLPTIKRSRSARRNAVTT
jgi:hypothetical protein